MKASVVMAAGPSGKAPLKESLEALGWLEHNGLPTGNALTRGVQLAVDALLSATESEVCSAAGALALVLSSVDDPEDLNSICRQIISGGKTIEVLCLLLEHDNRQINTDALLILGNMVIDSVAGPHGAAATKMRIDVTGGFPKLLAHLYSEDGTTLLYAVGAIMNALLNVEQVALAQSLGVMPRLQELAGSTDPELAQYASGCLHNMRTIAIQQRLPDAPSAVEQLQLRHSCEGAGSTSSPSPQQHAMGGWPMESPIRGAQHGSEQPETSGANEGSSSSFISHSVLLCLDTIDSSADADELVSALTMLSQLLSLTPDSNELAILGAVLREKGSVERLCDLLLHETVEIHSHALLILGNLASSSVDPVGAQETMQRMRSAGGFSRLVGHLYSTNNDTLLYALGTVMNTSADLGLASLLVAEGAVPLLQKLSTSTDPQHAEYARGSLVNMREAIMHHSAEQLYQKRMQTLATVEIQACARRRLARRKAAHVRDVMRRWNAAMIVSRMVRRRRRAKRRLEQRAAVIQQTWRSRLARRLRRRLHFEQGHAARTIQRAYRAYRERTTAGSAAIQIQSAHRGMLLRRELARHHEAAARVQALYRHHAHETRKVMTVRRIQASYRAHRQWCHHRARQIQRCYRSYIEKVERERDDAAKQAALFLEGLVNRPPPEVPRLDTSEAVARRQARSEQRDRRIARFLQKTPEVILLSPRAESIDQASRGSNVSSLKASSLMRLSPRADIFDPSAWFATTLENTSEYTMETERVSIARGDDVEGEVSMRNVSNDWRRSSTDLAMRSDDASRRESLSRNAARAARSTSKTDTIAKAVAFDSTHDIGKAAAHEKAQPDVSPTVVESTCIGCWPFWRRPRRVDYAP